MEEYGDVWRDYQMQCQSMTDTLHMMRVRKNMERWWIMNMHCAAKLSQKTVMEPLRPPGFNGTSLPSASCKCAFKIKLERCYQQPWKHLTSETVSSPTTWTVNCTTSSARWRSWGPIIILQFTQPWWMRLFRLNLVLTCTSKYSGVCHHHVAMSNMLLMPSPVSPGKTPVFEPSGFRQNSGSICETGQPSSSANSNSTSTFPGQRATNLSCVGGPGASDVRHSCGSEKSDQPILLHALTLKRYAVAIFSLEMIPCQVSSLYSEYSLEATRLESSSLMSTFDTSCHMLKKSAVQNWSWHSKTGAWLGVLIDQWSSKPSVNRLMQRGASQAALPKVSHSHERRAAPAALAALALPSVLSSLSLWSTAGRIRKL